MDELKYNVNISGNPQGLVIGDNSRVYILQDKLPPVATFAIDFNKIQGPHLSDEENFAELCNLLVAEEYPGAHLKSFEQKNNDSDLDCFIGELANPIHGFQHMYFMEGMDKSRKQQIAEHFIGACIGYNLSEWTLCVPAYLLPGEQEWLRTELPAQAANFLKQRMKVNGSELSQTKINRIPTIKINFWHQPKLLALLLKHPHVARIFFSGPPQDTLSSPARLIIDWGSVKWDYHNNAVFVIFALANVGGRIAKIEQISIEMLDSYPSPESESPWAGAVMQEFRFNVDLNPSCSKYIIGQDINFVYKHGDIDGFKIKLTSSARMFYKLVVKVLWYDIEEKKMHVTESEPFWARFPHI